MGGGCHYCVKGEGRLPLINYCRITAETRETPKMDKKHLKLSVFIWLYGRFVSADVENVSHEVNWKKRQLRRSESVDFIGD